MALATLTTVEYNAGEYVVAVQHAAHLLRVADGTIYGAIAESILTIAESMVGGPIPDAEAVLGKTALLAQQLGHDHYYGISHLNIAWLARASGNATRAVESAMLAIESLGSTSAGPEMDTVRTAAAWGFAHSGRHGARGY